MKSSKQLATEIERAVDKHRLAYRDLIRLAAKLKKLDQVIHRLKKRKRAALKVERDFTKRYPFNHCTPAAADSAGE